MTPDQYRFLIGELTLTVNSAGGHMRRTAAETVTAQRLNISAGELMGVSINAHADRALVYDLRSDSLTVPGSQKAR